MKHNRIAPIPLWAVPHRQSPLGDLTHSIPLSATVLAAPQVRLSSPASYRRPWWARLCS